MADIPDIPQSVDGSVRKPLARMREALQVLMGTRGDELDAAMTLRSLIELGLVDRIGNAIGGNVTYVNTFPGYTVPDPAGDPDLTPPPTPTGLDAVAGLTTVIVTWDAAAYTQGHGHKQANIYGVKKASDDPTEPTFTDATLITTAPGALTIASLPSDISTRWHLWIKFETNDGIESAAPAGGANGKVVQTGKIGSHDLGPLIIEAEHLANGAIPGKFGVSKFDTITVRGTGLNGANPGPGQMFIRDVHKGDTISRGFTARVFDRATHEQVADAVVWDTYGGGSPGGDYAPQLAMAAYLNALGDNRVVMIASFDACSFDCPDDALRLALKRLGASPAIDGAKGAARFQFCMVGIPGLGQGNGIEMLKPDTPGLPSAEVSCFWMDNTILGNGSTINGMTLLTGDYFVDGAVQARHLAANSIAAGTLAVQAGAIVNFMLGVGSIDDVKVANISAAKLTAGDGTIGGNLKSANYAAGATGWIVRPDGYAEFSNVVIRGATYTGTIYAGAGTIGGITIQSGDIRSYNYVPGSAGFRITQDGYIEASNVWLRGMLTGGSITGWAWPAAGQPGGFHLGPNGLLMGNYNNGQWVQINVDGSLSMPGFEVSGGNATFSGNLNAAGGTFKGSLTADAINAVNTINLAGGAVTMLGAPSQTGTSASVSVPVSVPPGNTYAVTVIGVQAAYRNANIQAAGSSALGVPGISTQLFPSEMGTTGTGQNQRTLYGYAAACVVNVLTLGPGTHMIGVSGIEGATKSVVCLVNKR